MKKLVLKSILASFVSLPFIAGAAESGGVDLTALTNAVSFEGVITGVLAVAGGLIVVYLSIAGAKTILRMVRGA